MQVEKNAKLGKQAEKLYSNNNRYKHFAVIQSKQPTKVIWKIEAQEIKSFLWVTTDSKLVKRALIAGEF